MLRHMCLGKCVFCLDVLLTSMRRLQCPVCYAAVMSNTTQDKDKFEDAKGVIRSRKSNERQQYDQPEKNKKTNKDLQNTTQKNEN